jgi:BirA family biotin operon repressor/biotin-[acetyl-CoA-carboxylase] ligase
MFSVLLRPPNRLATSGQLQLTTICVGLAVAAAARELAGDVVRLKWPNDLVIDPDGRKLAGVLAEAVFDPVHGHAVVVGCGCNANWPLPLPSDLAETAVSLNHLLGRDVDRVELLGATLTGVERRYASLLREGAGGLLAEYRAECATLGTTVRVELPGGAITGLAVDVDERGGLVLACDGGQRVVEVGDVTHVRSGRTPPSGDDGLGTTRRA